MPVDGVDAFPLCWPAGWKQSRYQSTSNYKSIAFGRTRDDVLHSLKLMGVSQRDIVMSTNVPLRLDGIPYAGETCRGPTGVAVYWVKDGKPQVMACDRWNKVGENMRAIWYALEALRTLDRCGSSQVIERAFMGFAALPAAFRDKPWREVLGLEGRVNREQIDDRVRELAKIHHPDKNGGDHTRMSEINAAKDRAIKELYGT